MKRQVKTALVSVYHKDGIVQFVKALIELGCETVYASGGTAKHLTEAGIDVVDVADLVGGGPILGHRVVTLSREVHAALLAKYTDADQGELDLLGLPRVDLVCVDLYPLEAEIAKSDCTLASVIEKIDIGGPTMLSSGSKGQRIVICDPADRQAVIGWLKNGQDDEDLPERLCAKADFIVSKYRMASAAYRSRGNYAGAFGVKVADCKYGENAYQTPASLFSSETDDLLSLGNFRLIDGASPSYNNWVEIDRQLQTMTHIAAAYSVNRNTTPLIAIGTKHGNPCGAAVGNSRVEVLTKMMAGDPLAIFGGLVMANFVMNDEEAEPLAGKMLDGITASGFTQGAIEKLRRKGDKCRFLVNDSLISLDLNSLDRAPRHRHVRGGFLVQPNYTFVPDFNRNPYHRYGTVSAQEMSDLILAWAVGSTSNSNTITIVKDGQLLGNGVGQQDRVGAGNLAVTRAIRSNHALAGAVAYSDSFFPFPDGPKVLLDAGVTAILTSSGSRRDQETIDLCAERHAGLIMIPDAEGRGFFGH